MAIHNVTLTVGMEILIACRSKEDAIKHIGLIYKSVRVAVVNCVSWPELNRFFKWKYSKASISVSVILQLPLPSPSWDRDLWAYDNYYKCLRGLAIQYTVLMIISGMKNRQTFAFIIILELLVIVLVSRFTKNLWLVPLFAIVSPIVCQSQSHCLPQLVPLFYS